MRTTIYATFVAIGASLAACGGSSSSSGGSGTCTPGQTATIGITSSGVSPTAVCVVPSGSVTFRNDDTASHDIESGTTCPQLNLGVIAPKASKTATFPTAMVCPFFDGANSTNAAFNGTVAVSSVQTTGPGY